MLSMNRCGRVRERERRAGERTSWGSRVRLRPAAHRRVPVLVIEEVTLVNTRLLLTLIHLLYTHILSFVTFLPVVSCGGTSFGVSSLVVWLY